MRKLFVQEKKTSTLSRFCSAKQCGEVENFVMNSELRESDKTPRLVRRIGEQNTESLITSGFERRTKGLQKEIVSTPGIGGIKVGHNSENDHTPCVMRDGQEREASIPILGRITRKVKSKAPGVGRIKGENGDKKGDV